MQLHPRNADAPPRTRTLLPPLRPKRKKRYLHLLVQHQNTTRSHCYLLISQEPKKAEKRVAAAASGDGETQAKRGRGRPKGSGKKAGGAAAAKAKVSPAKDQKAYSCPNDVLSTS